MKSPATAGKADLSAARTCERGNDVSVERVEPFACLLGGGAHQQLQPRRDGARDPRLTDAELVCSAVAQVLLVDSELPARRPMTELVPDLRPLTLRCKAS